jgi:hypothetical protein
MRAARGGGVVFVLVVGDCEASVLPVGLDIL